ARLVRDAASVYARRVRGAFRLRSAFHAWAIGTGLVIALGSTLVPGAVASPQRTLSLVAIGDSLPYGKDDCGYCATFVDRFGKALSRATHSRVNVSNLSEHTGIDSTDLR